MQTLPSRSSGTRVDASVVLLPVSVSLDLTRLDPERGRVVGAGEGDPLHNRAPGYQTSTRQRTVGLRTRAQLIGILRRIKSESPIVRQLTYRRGGEARG